MSSRISCWLHGHDWPDWGTKVYQDLFGNLWVLRYCRQCQAEQRRCIQAWYE